MENTIKLLEKKNSELCHQLAQMSDADISVDITTNESAVQAAISSNIVAKHQQITKRSLIADLTLSSSSLSSDLSNDIRPPRAPDSDQPASSLFSFIH